MLKSFTFSHSPTVKFGGCSPPHLMWDVATHSYRVPDPQAVPISVALHMQALAWIVKPASAVRGVGIPWAAGCS